MILGAAGAVLGESSQDGERPRERDAILQRELLNVGDACPFGAPTDRPNEAIDYFLLPSRSYLDSAIAEVSGPAVYT
ncbi:MAG: hypothetical protein WKG32_12800 [Gemmatimonadaceae bacterium]